MKINRIPFSILRLLTTLQLDTMPSEILEKILMWVWCVGLVLIAYFVADYLFSKIRRQREARQRLRTSAIRIIDAKAYQMRIDMGDEAYCTFTIGECLGSGNRWLGKEGTCVKIDEDANQNTMAIYNLIWRQLKLHFFTDEYIMEQANEIQKTIAYVLEGHSPKGVRVRVLKAKEVRIFIGGRELIITIIKRGGRKGVALHEMRTHGESGGRKWNAQYEVGILGNIGDLSMYMRLYRNLSGLNRDHKDRIIRIAEDIAEVM